MPIGNCKLCLMQKDLQDSHLLPAAMYKYIRVPLKRNPNPVIVGRKVTATSSRQVTDYLLCAECEELFNKNGEGETLRWVWNGKNFPLGDRLAVAHQHYTFKEFLAFSGTAVGIDTIKLGYFAVSVVWRAAVHQWDTPFGGKTTALNLGALEEPIRQYLHGDAPLPNDVVIVVTSCTDSASGGSFYVPSRVPQVPITCFGMLTLGVYFRVFVGPNIPTNIRDLCCVRSPQRFIFQRDCSEKTFEAFAQIMTTSKTSNKMP